MENYDELCPKFILNPHINPINNLPIADEEFDFYREVCKDLGYEFPAGKSLNLMYNNKYYGMKVCRDFLDDDTINPITGSKLFKGTEDYNNLLDLCGYYNFNVEDLGTRRSVKERTKRKSYLGKLPSELEIKLESKLLPVPKSTTKSVSTQKLGLLPIPKSRLSSGSELLPIPKQGLPSRTSKKSENENPLMNLKIIAREIPRDAGVKKVVLDSLSIILQKNADYKNNRYLISGTRNKYGIKQFVLDLMINNEVDLVMKILDFFGLQYIDIADFLFDFPSYATNESLIINYFINAPPETDWFVLNDILQDVYGDWVIKDKINLLIILLSSAVAVGNELLTEILVEVGRNWKDGLQGEIDEIDDIEEKDEIIDLVETLDTLSIR